MGGVEAATFFRKAGYGGPHIESYLESVRARGRNLGLRDDGAILGTAFPPTALKTLDSLTIADFN